jgi:uncharacterized protein YqhQ
MSKTYGGQAVLEGVMMRGQRHMAVACRAASGEIVVHSEPVRPSAYAGRWAKVPFVRGALMIWDTLSLGIRALMFAANVAAAETTEEARESAMPATVMWTTIAVALLGATGLFFVLPVVAMGYLDQFIDSSIVSNVVEKIIRLSLMLGYMAAIGQMPDIKRVFRYHGAEHKTINAYEAGAPLTPTSVQSFPIEHPRCGTTFLLIVMIISFFVFSLLGRPPIEIRIASRVLLVPVIAGIAYEFIRWAGANYNSSVFVRRLMAPGLAVQRLTTREPDLEQIAVAIAALEPVLMAEEPRRASVRVATAHVGEPAVAAVGAE